MAKVNGMKPIWNKANITKMFDKLQERAEITIIEILKRSGEEFVKLARENGSYQDWTGNLRSSIGYVIVKDGQIMEESSFANVQGAGENTAIVNYKTKDGKTVKFATKGRSGNGSEGSRAGRQLCVELAREYSTGYVLIGVAGMNYAAAVEAKGYDVISLSADKTDDFIQDMAKRLFDRLGIN